MDPHIRRVQMQHVIVGADIDSSSLYSSQHGFNVNPSLPLYRPRQSASSIRPPNDYPNADERNPANGSTMPRQRLYYDLEYYRYEVDTRLQRTEGIPTNHDSPAAQPSAVSNLVLREPVDLTRNAILDSQYPEHGGGYADIYAGRIQEGHGYTKVAIKVLRSHIYNNSEKAKLQKRLSREIRIWACFDHPNILPLLGTANIFGSNVSMVCPWMEEGDLAGYLSREKNVLTPELRMIICRDVANGLQYIHSRGFIHGDLTTGNVLVDSSGRAKLSDFGLSNIMADLRTESFKTSKVAGSARWAAPELIQIDNTVAKSNFSSDVYSLGSVILHVMSGQMPYEGFSETQVIFQIMVGNRPVLVKPQNLTTNCWRLITHCWAQVPDDRPKAGQVVNTLTRWQTPSGHADHQ